MGLGPRLNPVTRKQVVEVISNDVLREDDVYGSRDKS